MDIQYTRKPSVNTDQNGYTEDQQQEYIRNTATSLVDTERKVQESELSQDKNWIDSARILYTMQEGSEAETPPDAVLSKWALDYVAQTQYNLVSGAKAAYDFSNADDMQKLAMRYAMETYEMKDITASGALRFAKGLATDPTTYIGLGSFGIGFGAKAAATHGLKKAFMNTLSKTSTLAGIEGAGYGAAESGIQQKLEVGTGAREEVSGKEIALTAGIGAVGGKVIGEGIEYLGRKFSKEAAPAIQEIEQESKAIAQDVKANIGFAPELLGGSVNGLDYDEESGEFTFDPIRFMEGFLGGHVAKKIMTNPKLNAKAKREAMDYAQQTYDRLKDKPMFNYLTGTQRVIDDTPGASKSAELIKFNKDLAKQEAKHGKLESLEYSMMDISDRDLTRMQRAKQTIDAIISDPEDAQYLVPDFNEFNELYKDQFKYAKIIPQTKGDRVKIYRSATGDIEAGDWVGLDKSYAQSHGRTKEHKLYEKWVDKEDIRWQGQDANEWIYLPKEIIEGQ